MVVIVQKSSFISVFGWEKRGILPFKKHIRICPLQNIFPVVFTLALTSELRTGKNCFALKHFLRNESARCPPVLKQRKASCLVSASPWNNLCCLCGLTPESPCCLSFLGPVFHDVYYFSDYGKGVKIIPVKVKTCIY